MHLPDWSRAAETAAWKGLQKIPDRVFPLYPEESPKSFKGHLVRRFHLRKQGATPATGTA
jgi:hypothetical protein